MRLKKEITIYAPATDAPIATVFIEEGSKSVVTLMQDDHIELRFNLDEPKTFPIGSWCLIYSDKAMTPPKRYSVTTNSFPAYNEETGAYSYNLVMDAWYYAWKRYTFCLSPEYGANTSSFWYTQKLIEHVRLIFNQLRSIREKQNDKSIFVPSAVHIHYNGRTDIYSWENVDVETTVLRDGEAKEDIEPSMIIDDGKTYPMNAIDDNEPIGDLLIVDTIITEEVNPDTNEAYSLVEDTVKSVQYQDINIIEAISAMCAEEAFNCEWWMDDDEELHFGRCEFGTAITVSNAVDGIVTRQDSSGEYATSIVAFGSTRNIPARYHKSLIFEAHDIRKTADGYTHFTDAFRKPTINLFGGTKNYFLAIDESIPTSQIDKTENDVLYIDTGKAADHIQERRYLKRKTTNWQKQAMYDCELGIDPYYGYKVYTFNCTGGERIVVTGIPDGKMGFYLSRTKSITAEEIGQYINEGSSTGELNVSIDAFAIECTIEVTICGTMQVTVYKSQTTEYCRLANQIPTLLQPGRYKAEISGASFQFRLNDEFVSEEGEVDLEFEIIEPRTITIDIVDPGAIIKQHGVPSFRLKVWNIDSYYATTRVEFLTGAQKGKSFLNCIINGQDSKLQPLADQRSKDSFTIAASIDAKGIQEGDKFIVDGYREEDVPVSYFSDDFEVDTNISSYTRRLMLPVDECPSNRIQMPVPQASNVEIVKVFEDIYPSQVLTIAKVKQYTEQVEILDDNGKTYYEERPRYRIYLVKNGEGFKEIYISGGDLQCQFQDGLLAGLTFGLSFQGDSSEKDEEGNRLQEYAIVSDSNYGIELPNPTLVPKEGDSIVLLNYNPNALTDLGIVADAEQRLYTRAKAYLEKVSMNTGTYTAKMYYDRAKALFDSRGGLPRIGQKVMLQCPAYFTDWRMTRVIGTEQSLDIPWDNPQYTIGESVAYSRLNAIQNQIKNK